MTLEENKKLISKMIKKYCHKKHGGNTTCDECQELEQYAFLRLEKCPWGEKKPTCSKCPVHCYGKEMKGKIIEVMRYSGPRILFTAPRLSMKYLALKMKKPLTVDDLKKIRAGEKK
jgi:hypothetical protein